MVEQPLGICSRLLPPAQLHTLHKSGFTALEQPIHTPPQPYALQEALNRFGAAVSRAFHAGITLWAATLPSGAPWDLCSPNAEQRKTALQGYAYLLSACAQFAPPCVVLPLPGELPTGVSRESALANLHESLRLLDRLCLQCGLLLCVENPPAPAPGSTPAELQQLLAELASTRICLNDAHLPADTQQAWLQTLGKQVFTTHLHTPTAPLCQGLLQQGYQGPWILHAESDALLAQATLPQQFATALAAACTPSAQN